MSRPDGQYMVAAAYSDYIYTSTDHGSTWNQTSSVQANWVSVAISNNGSVILAAAMQDYVYLSFDGGSTFAQVDPPAASMGLFWRSVCMSGDASIMVVAMPGQMFRSVDGGSTWANVGGNAQFKQLACTSDGAHFTAISQNGPVSISADYGATFTDVDMSRQWSAVAMSQNGSIQVAVVDQGGDVFVSQDYGSTWSQISSGFVLAVQNGMTSLLQAAAITGSGDRIYACQSNEYCYVSRDLGSSWNYEAALGSGGWSKLAFNEPGSRGIAAVFGTAYLFVYQPTPISPSPTPTNTPTPSATPAAEL